MLQKVDINKTPKTIDSVENPLKNGFHEHPNTSNTSDNDEPCSSTATRSAYDRLSHLFGIYKDDPYAKDVWDRIVASRHDPTEE